MALASVLHCPWTVYTGLTFPPLVHFLHLIFIYQLLVHAIIFIILSLCLPVALLSIPISHPLPAALSRSAILHDMSEDAFEQCTPVMVLSPARKESGKKAVKQRPRRRRRASERYEPAEEQIKGKRNDFQITSPRWSELYADSSDSSSADETHWIQAKRRAQVKFRLSRRRRRNGTKPCGNVDGPSAPPGTELVDVESKGKRQQELTECESCSLNLCRGKGTRYQECSLSLPRGSFEIERSSRKHEERKGRYDHRDLQLLHRLGQYETIQKRLSEADSSPDILTVAEGGKYVDTAGFQGSNSMQKPPATYHDGSDNLKICRSVTIGKDLMPSTGISSLWELGVCLTSPLKT